MVGNSQRSKRVIHMTDPEADMAEHWLAQSKRELARYPRNSVIPTPETAKAIDLSGIFRMDAEQIDAALRALVAA